MRGPLCMTRGFLPPLSWPIHEPGYRVGVSPPHPSSLYPLCRLRPGVQPTEPCLPYHRGPCQEEPRPGDKWEVRQHMDGGFQVKDPSCRALISITSEQQERTDTIHGFVQVSRTDWGQVHTSFFRTCVPAWWLRFFLASSPMEATVDPGRPPPWMSGSSSTPVSSSSVFHEETSATTPCPTLTRASLTASTGG